MGLLARREHARHELESKLAARGHGADAVAETLDTLEADGLLSDRRFAEQFVESRATRGQGPLKIRHELAERGVGRELAEGALEEAGLDWRVCALEARIRRFGSQPPEDHRERARQRRFLSGRGFSAEQVRWALGDGEGRD